MNIYAISDLHMSVANPKPMDVFGSCWNNYLEIIRDDWLKKVGSDDVVLISGDISWAMNTADALKDMEYFRGLPGTKIFIRGNHDYWWKSISRIREAVPEGCVMLQNDAVRIGNYVFCGSRSWLVPGSPDFSESDKKLYLREIERLRLAFFKAQELKEEGDKLVCMTHYPPFNVRREPNEIIDLIEQNGVNAVVYGHLHGKDVRADKIVKRNSVLYYLSSCDLVGNELVKIEV